MNQDRNHQHPSEAQTDMAREGMDRHLTQDTNQPQFPDLATALQSLDETARATGHRTEPPETTMDAMIARLEKCFPKLLGYDAKEAFLLADSVLQRLLTDGSASSWGRAWDYATRNLLLREAHDLATQTWADSQTTAEFMMSVSIHQDFNTAGLWVLAALDAHDALRQETNTEGGEL